VNSKGKEVPHGVRLYSIASSRYGDFFDGKSTTLCVRRAVYNDPETGNEDPAKKGICSNFLCDAKPGDEIMMTGACPVLNPVLTAAQQLCPTVLDM
jgi:ferredoxin--NADP+ reductase